MKRFDANRTYRGPGVPYHDPERVPMILLLVGLMVGFVLFLWWAITP